MKTEILHQFRTRFGQAPLLVQAPGRINLIGEHTDYNLGWVLPGAIDKSLWFALGLHPDPNQFQMLAADLGESHGFPAGVPFVPERAGWAEYVQAVVWVLEQEGYPVKGLQGVFGGDIPMGAGLSSSAALCCGFIFGIAALQGLDIPRPEIARLAQAAEHRIGLNCGLMDQYAVLFGQRDHLICLDCKTLAFERFPLQLTGYTLVLINSRIKHELAAGSGYNERRQSCERVVARLQAEHPALGSLRDVEPSLLSAYQDRLDPLDYRRAAYVLAENQRVLHTVAALQQNDLREVGRTLFEAHEGMRTEYEITVPELDLLVELAHAEPGVLGARQVGGGFGGCTLNLIRSAEKDAILARMTGAYAQHTGIQPEIIEVHTHDGVQVVDLEESA
ncbi:MAG: galactokinase [Saprospiraceae bacterium]|nr:galactokinase [Saprospiraceae bacterium]